MSKEQKEYVTYYLKKIDRKRNEEPVVLDCLMKLSKVPVVAQVLEECGAHKFMLNLAMQSGKIGERATDLSNRWNHLIAAAHSNPAASPYFDSHPLKPERDLGASLAKASSDSSSHPSANDLNQRSSAHDKTYQHNKTWKSRNGDVPFDNSKLSNSHDAKDSHRAQSNPRSQRGEFPTDYTLHSKDDFDSHGSFAKFGSHTMSHHRRSLNFDRPDGMKPGTFDSTRKEPPGGSFHREPFDRHLSGRDPHGGGSFDHAKKFPSRMLPDSTTHKEPFDRHCNVSHEGSFNRHLDAFERHHEPFERHNNLYDRRHEPFERHHEPFDRHHDASGAGGRRHDMFDKPHHPSIDRHHDEPHDRPSDRLHDRPPDRRHEPFERHHAAAGHFDRAHQDSHNFHKRPHDPHHFSNPGENSFDQLKRDHTKPHQNPAISSTFERHGSRASTAEPHGSRISSAEPRGPSSNFDHLRRDPARDSAPHKASYDRYHYNKPQASDPHHPDTSARKETSKLHANLDRPNGALKSPVKNRPSLESSKDAPSASQNRRAAEPPPQGSAKASSSVTAVDQNGVSSSSGGNVQADDADSCEFNPHLNIDNTEHPEAAAVGFLSKGFEPYAMDLRDGMFRCVKSPQNEPIPPNALRIIEDYRKRLNFGNFILRHDRIVENFKYEDEDDNSDGERPIPGSSRSSSPGEAKPLNGPSVEAKTTPKCSKSSPNLEALDKKPSKSLLAPKIEKTHSPSLKVPKIEKTRSPSMKMDPRGGTEDLEAAREDLKRKLAELDEEERNEKSSKRDSGPLLKFPKSERRSSPCKQNARPLPKTPLANCDKTAKDGETTVCDQFTSSRKDKRIMYSGKKNSHEIGPLKAICIQYFKKNTEILIRSLKHQRKEVPFETVRPVLLHVTPHLLHKVDCTCPYLRDHTAQLWQDLCLRDFKSNIPNATGPGYTEWRNLYWKLYQEKKNKLKTVTATISAAAAAKCKPENQIKVALVDTPLDDPQKRRKWNRPGEIVAPASDPSSTSKKPKLPPAKKDEDPLIPKFKKNIGLRSK